MLAFNKSALRPWQLVLAAVVVLAACASGVASISTSRTSSYAGPAFKKIMVIGMSRNAANRKLYEDTFAKQIRSYGVTAFSSYEALPEEGEITVDRVREAVKANGADAVMVSRVTGSTTISVPTGNMDEMPGFPGWYVAGWSGSPQDDTQDVGAVVIESTLWNVKTDKPLWRGVTKQLESKTVAQNINDLAAALISKLRSDSLI